ncbi:MAG: DUF4012 domain-containing protein [Caldilineaceae bacterium]|nr:DUF4012 domain-containing protein [Caldilineaceae bacterium]
MHRKRLVWRTIWVILGILLCIVLYKAVRTAFYLQNAYRAGTQFTQFLRNDLNEQGIAVAQSFLQESATAVAQAEQEMRFFRPALQQARLLPWIGPSLAAIPPLFEAGSELAQIAVIAYPAFQPVLLTPRGRSPIAQLPAALAAAEPQLAEINARTERVTALLQTIRPSELNFGLQEAVADLQGAVALITPSLRLGTYLPELLGIGQARTYLVLAQNNHELRATGGFITAIGRVTVMDGHVIGLDFVDSYDPLISRTDLALPSAPKPVQRFMNIDIMLLRDSNWSPDLPTTAQIARTIYTQQTGRTIDGVITVDLHAVESIVSALEPLILPGVDEPLTSATVVERIKQFWASPLESEASLASGQAEWWKQRKDFIPLLARSAITRIQQGNFDKLRMIGAVQQTLDTRSLQVWLANVAAAQELARLGWDGALKPPSSGDFLALVDTNFGYNKVDAVLQRTLQYQVEWPQGAGQPGIATVAITYRHPYERPGYVCDQRPHYENSYEEMMVRCYYDYVRVFAPGGSELLGSSGLMQETVSSERGEGGAQLFSGYFILAPGDETMVVFQYRLPPAIQPEGYALLVRRQAGTGPLPFSATINHQSVQTSIENGRFTWPYK